MDMHLADGDIIVSVIIPIYNVEKYIEECLTSLFKHNNPSVEFICIDDGSTDASGRICDLYAAKYSNCRAVHTKNRGISATRNLGLQMAQGRYLAFVDPDDYVADTWLQSILELTAKESWDMLIFDYYRLTNTELSLRSYGKASGFLDKEVLLQEVVTDRKIQSQVWQKVFKRELFKELWFPEDYKTLEDYAIFHLLVERASSIYYLHKPLYIYRIRLERLSQPVNLQQAYINYLIAKDRYEYFSNKGVAVSQIGVYVQILLFCTVFWQADPLAREKFKQQYTALQNIVAKNLRRVIFARDLDIKFKIKYLLVYLKLDYVLALYFRYGILGSLKRIIKPSV